MTKSPEPVEVIQADINLVALVWSYAHDTDVDAAIRQAAAHIARHRLDSIEAVSTPIMEICPDCAGAGGDNNTYVCSRCAGTGGIEAVSRTGDGDALAEAGQTILDRMFSTYKARNGREMGIQAADGEKCWIVHDDEIQALRQAHATPIAAHATPVSRTWDHWRPIETAPKDGTLIDVWVVAADPALRSRITDASWREPTDSEWWVHGGDTIETPEACWHDCFGPLGSTEQPTHWMPHPCAPGSTPVSRTGDGGELERVATAVGSVIYGTDTDPFEQPERWEHLEEIATAAIAALSTPNDSAGFKYEGDVIEAVQLMIEQGRCRLDSDGYLRPFPEVDDSGLVEALEKADDAIKEMFRYFDGGETRGSYDGKPERNQLRKAGYAITAALSQHKGA